MIDIHLLVVTLFYKRMQCTILLNAVLLYTAVLWSPKRLCLGFVAVLRVHFKKKNYFP